MGYESLARGNKTISFSLRLFKEEDSFKFGWPNHNSYKDKVYVANTTDKLSINNKIDYILNLKDVEWKKEVESFRQIMEYDKYNSIFKNTIKKLL